MAAEQMQGRFAALDEEEFQTLLDNSEAENTKRSTVTAVKAFRDYLTEKLFSADFENYNKEELDQKLSTFYSEMRNKKGKLYKKSTLISYRTGLQRHLEKCGSDFDIIRGVAFKKSIKSFKSMTKELKRQGLANVEHFPVICDEDLEKIYDHLTSNLEDAQLLQYKVFMDIMLHFGVRGRKNLSSLTRSHFDVAQNSEGAMYVYSTLYEKSKSRQDNKERSPGRTMYEIKESHKCPVRSFVKYIRRLNPRCDRLFQQPRKQPKDGVYYDNVALGHNKLGTFMNQISVRCGLTTIYTNHSCHATTAHVLDSGQCLSRHLSVTVHKAESSLKTREKTDERTKKLLSEKIAERIKKKCTSHANTWTGKKIVPEDLSSMSEATHQENRDSPSSCRENREDPLAYRMFVYNPGVLLHMTCENVEPESQSGNSTEVTCNIKQEPIDAYFEGESENSEQSKELSLDSQTSHCTSMSSIAIADREIKVESDCQNHDQLSEGAWKSTNSDINSSIQVMGGNSDSVNTFSNTDVHSDNNIRNESQFSSDWRKNCLNDLTDTLKKTTSSKRKKYRQWSPTQMATALKCIKEDKMSVNKASILFNIPLTTLRDRVDGRVSEETLRSGPETLLSQEEEARLVNHIKYMAQLGYGFTRSQVLELATDFAVHIGKREKSRPLSMFWFYDFLSRWPELTAIKPRSLASVRAKSASPQVTKRYITELQLILNKYNLNEKPEAIYNIEEKGINTEHVVSPKDLKTQTITSPRSASITIIGCGNASGQQIPPYYVFSGKQMQDELLEGGLPGTNGTVTETGWSNSEVFETYLKDHFQKFVHASTENPILLLFDGHASHLTLSVIEWAKELGIILFVFPPHCSHFLQPMDIGCFGTLGKIYNIEAATYMRIHPGQVISRLQVCEISSKAYSQALSPENLRSAFQRSGVYPLNLEVISKSLPTVFSDNESSTCSLDLEVEVVEEHGEKIFYQNDVAMTTMEDSNKASVSCEQNTVLNNTGRFCDKKKINTNKSKTKKRKSIHPIVSGKANTEDQTGENEKGQDAV